MGFFSKRKKIILNKTQTETAKLSTSNFSKIVEGSIDDSSEYDGDIWRDNDVYLDYLKDWSYVRLLKENYTVPVIDVLKSSKPNIVLPESVKDKEPYIVKQLEKIDILGILISEIDGIIYDKPMVRYLAYDKNKEIFQTLPIDVDSSLEIIKKYDQIVGIIHKGKFIGIDKLILGYDNLIKTKTTLDDLNSTVIDKDEILNNIDDEIKEDLIVYQGYKHKSTFWYQAPLLYQIYLNELMQQCLGIKETLKQEILTVAVQGSNKKIVQLNNITNALEKVLNANNSLILNQDPVTLTNELTRRLMNGYKVLGSITDYSQISQLDCTQDGSKKELLLNEIQRLKSQVLNNLGIPLEISDSSATANRWEILSRSDRYLSVITKILKICSDIVKQTASSMLRTIGYDIPSNEIQYNLINSTNVQSQLSRNKVQALSENIYNLNQSITEFKTLLSSELTDIPTAIDEFLLRVQRDEVPFSNSFKTKDEILNMLMGPASGEEGAEDTEEEQ